MTFVGLLVAVPFTFQNRPPVAAEHLSLHSGDIEAVEYPRMPAFPHPPQPPQPMQPPAPYNRPRQATRAPAPSPSLAPVAMNAVRGRADSTVPPPPARGSAPEMVVRTRPSLKAGFGILLAGAVIGSILGITTTPKAAVAAYQPATDFVSASTLPPAAKDELPPPAAKVDVAPKDEAPAAKDEEKPVAGKKTAAKRAFAPATRVASAGTPKPEKPAKAAKDDDSDDGYRVASADSSVTKSSAKKKPAPKDDDDDDAPAPPPKKKPKASDDAASVLRAAMGATENTL